MLFSLFYGLNLDSHKIDSEDIKANIIGKGAAKNKKNAEKEAAREALLYYGLVNGY